MRKLTIVVAILAATVASAEAAPKSVNLTQGTSVRAQSQTRTTSTAAQASKSRQSRNLGAAASGGAQIRKPFGAMVPALGLAGARASTPVSVPASQVRVRVGRATSRAAVRSILYKRSRYEMRRYASARRLAKKSRVVALSREVPSERIERPSGSVAVNAPTGAVHGMVTAAAQRAGVSPALGHAVVKVESMYDPRATGRGGYIGLMQLSYQTAKGMGFPGSRQALYEPSSNLQYGMRYLAEAVRKAGGSTCGAVSKYQGGHGVRGVTSAGAVYCAKVRRYMASTG